MDKGMKKEFGNLGKMIKGGFDSVDQGFVGVNQRFDKIDKALQKNKKDHEAFRARFNNLDRRMDVLVMENSKDHKEIKKDLAQIKRQLKKTVTETELVELEQRVEILEERAGLTA